MNIETLLEPISNDKPTGDDLRYELIDAKRDQIYWYDKIREARREDPFEMIPKKADWGIVREYAQRALTTKSKDLQIAAWFAESMIIDDSRDQFDGVADGLTLLRGLIEKYWGSMYPPIDGDDPEAGLITRANIISIFSNAASTYLKDTPVIEGESYRYYKSKLDSLNKCCEEAQQLDELIDEKLERGSSGLRVLRNTLDDLRLNISKFEKETRPDIYGDDTSENNNHSVDISEEGRTPASAGALKKRADALRRLAEVAEYFRRTEPHSPLSFLIQRAVRWGSMPLDQLFNELIKDQSVLFNIRETLGMNNE